MNLNNQIFSLREAIIKAKRKAVKQESSSSQSQDEHQNQQIDNNQKDDEEQDGEQNQRYEQNEHVIVHQSIQRDSFNNRVNRNSSNINKEINNFHSQNQHSFQQSNTSLQQEEISQLAHNLYSSRKVKVSHEKSLSFQMKQSIEQRLKLSIQKSPLTYSRTLEPVGESRVSNFTIMNSQQSTTNRMNLRLNSLRRLMEEDKQEKQYNNYNSQQYENKSNRLKYQKQRMRDKKQRNKDQNKRIRNQRQSRKIEQYRRQVGLSQQCQSQQDEQQIDKHFKYRLDSNMLQIPRLFSSINKQQPSKNIRQKRINNNPTTKTIRQLINKFSIKQLIDEWKETKQNNQSVVFIKLV